ncbi:branched-chain amino acid ABC transporter substrate-binding protein [Castellaniella sp. GW247-6E4]|uniref:branched-chain amino acid ABC transporter substrate-binding protein n=1 Tax=Castellaniella sp. GW247-6E4 TaxID=3140380 RepID=UPI003314C1A9
MIFKATVISAAILMAMASTPAQSKDTVKIAFIGPLSGGNSATGIGGRNSAETAVRVRNEKGDSKYNYELVALDDECKPNVGVQVATRVATDRSIIAGVTHFCSAVAIATVDVYHRFGFPVVIWGAILPEITYAHDYKEVHRVNGSMLDETEVATNSLIDMGYKKWVVIHDTTDYGNVLYKMFQEKATKRGGEIVASFGVGANQQDFSAELLQIKEMKPDVVVFAGLTPLGVRVRSQMEHFGVETQFAAVSGIMSTSYFDALGKTAEGTLSFHNAAPLTSMPGGKAFLENYSKAKYSNPPEPYGPYAYVAADLIMNAIEQVGPDRKKVQAVLNQTKNYQSIAGPINFDDHRNNSVASTRYVAQDGDWVQWEKSEYASGKRQLKGR